MKQNSGAEVTAFVALSRPHARPPARAPARTPARARPRPPACPPKNGEIRFFRR